MNHRAWTMLLLVIAAASVSSIFGTIYAQNLASKNDSGAVAIADHFLAGVSAATMQERCSVRNQAASTTCECGPNKTKVQAACVTCSTPSGKNCSTKCQQCAVVCDPRNSVPSQSLDCN